MTCLAWFSSVNYENDALRSSFKIDHKAMQRLNKKKQDYSLKLKKTLWKEK